MAKGCPHLASECLGVDGEEIHSKGVFPVSSTWRPLCMLTFGRACVPRFRAFSIHFPHWITFSFLQYREARGSGPYLPLRMWRGPFGGSLEINNPSSISVSIYRHILFSTRPLLSSLCSLSSSLLFKHLFCCCSVLLWIKPLTLFCRGLGTEKIIHLCNPPC